MQYGASLNLHHFASSVFWNILPEDHLQPWRLVFERPVANRIDQHGDRLARLDAWVLVDDRVHRARQQQGLRVLRQFVPDEDDRLSAPALVERAADAGAAAADI